MLLYTVYALEAFLLFLAGIEDIRKQEIRMIYAAAMGIVACCGLIFGKNPNWYGALGGLVIGLCMLGLSVISQEQIGKGDGLVTAALGILCGVRNTLGMVCFASLFMFPAAVVVMLLKKGKRKIRMPFLPALFLGYIMMLFLGGML